MNGTGSALAEHSEGIMTLRKFVALSALSAAIVTAGWALMGDSTPSDVADPDLATAEDTATLETADPSGGTTGFPVADAAIVDSSLFDPHPMLGRRAVADSAPVAVRMVSLGALAPGAGAPPAADAPSAQGYAVDEVGALHGEPAAAAVRKAITVPKLDRDTGLTLAHIPHIKASLNLTPEQQRYWPQVEAELRELARQAAAQKAAGRKPTLGASDAQRLYWAAGPLILSLTEEQKQEIRRIARALGLTQVASLI
jgi:hypothetical protein